MTTFQEAEIHGMLKDNDKVYALAVASEYSARARKYQLRFQRGGCTAKALYIGRERCHRNGVIVFFVLRHISFLADVYNRFTEAQQDAFVKSIIAEVAS